MNNVKEIPPIKPLNPFKRNLRKHALSNSILKRFETHFRRMCLDAFYANVNLFDVAIDIRIDLSSFLFLQLAVEGLQQIKIFFCVCEQSIQTTAEVMILNSFSLKLRCDIYLSVSDHWPLRFLCLKQSFLQLGNSELYHLMRHLKLNETARECYREYYLACYCDRYASNRMLQF